MRLRQCCKPFGITANTGGRFRVHKCQHFCIGMRTQRSFRLVQIYRLAPVVLHQDRLRTATLDVLFHTSAKHAVLTDNRLVSTLQQIDKDSFHAS